jgi:hypothetical protein
VGATARVSAGGDDAVLMAHVGAQALEQARHRQTRMSRQRRAGRARAGQVRDPGGSEQPGTSSSVRVEQRVRSGAASRKGEIDGGARV